MRFGSFGGGLPFPDTVLARAVGGRSWIGGRFSVVPAGMLRTQDDRGSADDGVGRGGLGAAVMRGGLKSFSRFSSAGGLGHFVQRLSGEAGQGLKPVTGGAGFPGKWSFLKALVSSGISFVSAGDGGELMASPRSDGRVVLSDFGRSGSGSVRHWIGGGLKAREAVSGGCGLRKRGGGFAGFLPKAVGSGYVTSFGDSGLVPRGDGEMSVGVRGAGEAVSRPFGGSEGTMPFRAHQEGNFSREGASVFSGFEHDPGRGLRFGGRCSAGGIDEIRFAQYPGQSIGI